MINFRNEPDNQQIIGESPVDLLRRQHEHREDEPTQADQRMRWHWLRILFGRDGVAHST